MAALLFALLAQRIGVEITNLEADASIDGDLAVTKVTIELRSWSLSPREAELWLGAPAGAVIADVDYGGAINPDVQVAMEPDEIRRELIVLRREAEKDVQRGAVTTTTTVLAPKTPARTTVVRRPPQQQERQTRDPSMISKSGDASFRLRFWPLAPASEDRQYVRSATGHWLNGGNARKTRTPGAPQRAVLYVVHRLREVDGELVYEFPLRLQSDAGRLPAFKTRGTAFSGVELVRGSMDERANPMKAGRADPIRWVFRPTEAHGDATTSAHPPYDMAWAADCLAAADDPDRAREMKVVTKGSSLLLADTELFEALGREAPANGPKRLVKSEK